MILTTTFFNDDDEPEVKTENLCTDADTKFKKIPGVENKISKISSEISDLSYDMNEKKKEGQNVSDMEAQLQDLQSQLDNSRAEREQLLQESLDASAESLKVEEASDTLSWENSWKLPNQQRMIQIYLRMSKFDEAYKLYSEVLKVNLSSKNLENYVDSVITQNVKTRLYAYGGEATPDKPLGPQQVFEWYNLTNKALEESSNWSLWFKYSRNFLHVFHEAGYADPTLDPHPLPALKAEIPKVIGALYRQLQGNDKDKAKKLEIYAINISLAYLTGDVAKMKELYSKARPLFKYSAGVDLKIQAQLRLLGGQMFLHDQSFINAASEYVEAAKQYKAASLAYKSLAPLFYAVVCNMIASEMFPDQNSARAGRVFFDTMSVGKETEALRQIQDSLGQNDLALNSAQSMRSAFDKCELEALQTQVDIFKGCMSSRKYQSSFTANDKENFERLIPKVWDAVEGEVVLPQRVLNLSQGLRLLAHGHGVEEHSPRTGGVLVGEHLARNHVAHHG